MKNRGSKNQFSECLHSSRKSVPITAENLAKAAGVDRTYISKMENHGWLPTLDVASRLSTILKDPDLLSIFLEVKYPKTHNRLQVYGLKKTDGTTDLSDLATYVRENVLDNEKHYGEHARYLVDNLLPDKAKDKQFIAKIIRVFKKFQDNETNWIKGEEKIIKELKKLLSQK